MIGKYIAKIQFLPEQALDKYFDMRRKQIYSKQRMILLTYELYLDRVTLFQSQF